MADGELAEAVQLDRESILAQMVEERVLKAHEMHTATSSSACFFVGKQSALCTRPTNSSRPAL